MQQSINLGAPGFGYAPTFERIGFFRRIKIALFGEADIVTRQLRALSRQGQVSSRIFHLLSYALLILFSAASLVALGADALQQVTTSWQRGELNIPAAIAVSVVLLIVPVMDAGALAAAGNVRVHRMHHGKLREVWVDVTVMGIVCAIEAGNYLYMTWRYENPAGVAWALLIARALAAPLLSVYLAMQKPHAIQTADILALVDFHTGQLLVNLLKGLTESSGDNLARIAAIYRAASHATPAQRTALAEIIEVLQGFNGTLAGEGAYNGLSNPGGDGPARPPSGPRGGRRASAARNDSALNTPSLLYSGTASASNDTNEGALKPVARVSKRAPRSVRASKGHSARKSKADAALATQERALAFAILSEAASHGEDVAIKELARRLDCSEPHAKDLKTAWTRAQADAASLASRMPIDEASAQ